jgi:hypothetical protein
MTLRPPSVTLKRSYRLAFSASIADIRRRREDVVAAKPKVGASALRI